MPTNEDITTAIQAGIDRVNNTFKNLSDEQLATRVHDGDNGWTAKQILAHLAGRQRVSGMIGMAARGEALPDMRGLDFNAINQEMVDARSDKSRDELLAEFNEVHTSLQSFSESLTDEQLAISLDLPFGTRTVKEMLLGSGGSHSIGHSEEVEQALSR
mgnify:FL=1